MTGSMCRARRLALVAGIGGTLMLALAGTAAARQSHARYAARAKAALIRYLKHQGAPAVRAPRPGGLAVSNTTQFSYNWSGYEDSSTTDGAFTKVSGAWVVPAVT